MLVKRIAAYTNLSSTVSEIATFSYPLAFNAPVGGVLIGIPGKTRIMGLPGSENSLTIGWVVLTQYQRATDRQTDGRTDLQPIADARKNGWNHDYIHHKSVRKVT